MTPAPRPRRPVAALRLSGRNARLCAPQRFIGRSPQVETRLLLFFSLFKWPSNRLYYAQTSCRTGDSRAPRARTCAKAPRRGLGLYWRESIAHRGLRGASPLRRSEARGCDRVCIPRCAPQSPADDARADAKPRLDTQPSDISRATRSTAYTFSSPQQPTQVRPPGL